MKINTGCWVNGCKCFNPNDEDGVWIKKDRDWVGLTNEEVADILCSEFQHRPELMLLQVQAMLKEKNNG